MPHKPKHPCAWPGCPALTNERYCEYHAKIEARHYEQHQRDPETKERYGAEWKRIRKRYAEEHPLCEECLSKGIYVPVEQVHHRLPLAEGGTHDESNLVSLCASCHARLHALRGDRWGKHKAAEYTHGEGRFKSLGPGGATTAGGLHR